MTAEKQSGHSGKITRRRFLKTASVTAAAGAAAVFAGIRIFKSIRANNATFIARVRGYQDNLRVYILAGLRELGITSKQIQGKNILLKPNLVEPHLGIGHINTHPLIVRAAIEAFKHLGAGSVLVAEGSGHRRDSYLILEEAKYVDILKDDKVPFIDLNTAEVIFVKNLGKYSRLTRFAIPKPVLAADIIVSMAKMKTHHWVGATLSMKNMFGILPGSYYGWPKNLLHVAGINQTIVDINTTIRPQLAIIDGVVGMEGDGPIMGEPVEANVIVMGRSLPAVDATCARIMGINPAKIRYIEVAAQHFGTIRESLIEQRGEPIASVQRDFRLIDFIPAHQGIRL